MSQSVDILIKADDQASQKVADAATAVDKSLKRVEQITKALETPSERYTQQLREMTEAYEAGIITAEQFADAEQKLTEKLDAIAESAEKSKTHIAAVGEAVEKSSGKIKATTNTLAGLMAQAGSSELAGVTRQFGALSESVGQFSEAAKSGAGGAVAMKAGMIGLAATIGFTIGKVLADVIWQTDAFEASMQKAKEQAKELDDELKKLNATLFANTKEDIELIRDPAEKQAAYKQLMGELDRDIQSVSANVRKSQADVDAWAAAWKITGDRKQYEQDAQEQLKLDQERLAALKDQRAEIEKIAGARALENEQIRKSNEEKDKSAEYLQTLKDEVEYLAATREEQIKLDAARNVVEQDRGEAERLLKERDALIAKKEAQEELEREQKRAAEEAAKAAKKAADDAAHEQQRIEDLVIAERQRLEVQKIAIEQGAEAARVKDLMNQGVDEKTARALAAEEQAVNALKHKDAAPLQASESRLLTRGEGFNPMADTNKLLEDVRTAVNTMVTIGGFQFDAQQIIAQNTQNTVQVTVPQ